MSSTAGPYSIGSERWPGLAKVAEECAEVIQVVGKVIAANGEAAHWDGTDLRARLEDEIADARAAMQFMARANGLDASRMADRTANKIGLFRRWHAEHLDGSAQLAGAEPVQGGSGWLEDLADASLSAMKAKYPDAVTEES